MKYSLIDFKRPVATLLLAVTLCIQLPLAVLADDTKPLEALKPQLDTSVPAEPESAEPSSKVHLNGGVRIRGEAQPAMPEDQEKYQLAATKLASGAKMTSDDFRDLQIGIIGEVTVRPFNEDNAKVTLVYPGCPADLAGIRKGDVQVLTEDEQKNPEDTSHPVWDFTGGRAGAKVDVTILRDGDLLSFTLTRMNIEDMPDANLRKKYEQLARQLGPSGEGTVEVSDQTSFLVKAGKLQF